MSLFYPSMIRRRITDITLEDLHALGAQGLLLDVDNTLTTHGSQTLDPAVKDWLEKMAGEGISLTIVSNALPRRVQPFAEKIGLRAIAFACKPFPVGFFRGARRLVLPRQACVVVGDQVFTDILGARLGRFPSILLEPIRNENGKPTLRLKRWLEKGIRRRFSQKTEKKVADA